MQTLFVGLGVMGAAMAPHVRAEADPLWLYDLDQQGAEKVAANTGSSVLRTLEDLPESLEAVVLMLPTSAIVESVLVDRDRLLQRLEPGTLVIDMGSSVPASTVQLHKVAKARGIDYVDAPVSGGIAKASQGKLTIMAGAEGASVFGRALPLLKSMGEAVIHVGGPGSGHAAKALNNLLGAINLSAASEVLAVATKFGIKPGIMIDVLNVSTGRNQATEYKFPTHILSGTYGARFDIDLMIKDVEIAQNLAQSMGVRARIAEQALEIARAARENVGQGKDHTEVARYFENTYGISFREGANS